MGCSLPTKRAGRRMSGVLGLREVFDLERCTPRHWRGSADGVKLPQLYGGQLLAQSVIAGGREAVEGQQIQTMHTVYLRPGAPGTPVDLHVEPLHEGRTRSTYRIGVLQQERLLCESFVSTVRPIPGLTHDRPAPAAPRPEACPSLREAAAHDGGLGAVWDGFWVAEVRIAPAPADPAPRAAAPPQHVWMRAVESLGDDPLLHRAAVAYLSDLMLMATAVSPHGLQAGAERSLDERWIAVSLDHGLRFYGELRADGWMLFEQTTPRAHASRALIEATVFDERGRTAAHATQDALIRERPSADV